MKAGDRVWYTSLNDRKDTGVIVEIDEETQDAMVRYDSGEEAWTALADLEPIKETA